MTGGDPVFTLVLTLISGLLSRQLKPYARRHAVAMDWSAYTIRHTSSLYNAVLVSTKNPIRRLLTTATFGIVGVTHNDLMKPEKGSDRSIAVRPSQI
jgi:hypothetical protein